MNSKWGKKWTALYIVIVGFIAFMFVDNGKLFIDFIWWATTPLVHLFELLLG